MNAVILIDASRPASSTPSVATERVGGSAGNHRAYSSFIPGKFTGRRRPELAAVVLVGRPPLFATWAASIRHRPLPAGSEVVYTLTFTCRPTWLAPLFEPVALAAFRWETARRLRALARHLATG